MYFFILVYQELRMMPNRYIENYKNFRKFTRQMEMKDFLTPIGKDSWKESILKKSPYYEKETNRITIPVGALQPPFFYSDPKPAAFGGLGSIVGK